MQILLKYSLIGLTWTCETIGESPPQRNQFSRGKSPGLRASYSRRAAESDTSTEEYSILLVISSFSAFALFNLKSYIFKWVSWIEHQLLCEFAKPKVFFGKTKLLQFLPQSDSLSINTTVGFLAHTGELIQQMESNRQTLSSSCLSTGVHLLALFNNVTMPARQKIIFWYIQNGIGCQKPEL